MDESQGGGGAWRVGVRCGGIGGRGNMTAAGVVGIARAVGEASSGGRGHDCRRGGGRGGWLAGQSMEVVICLLSAKNQDVMEL